ncbi:MAG: purine phosphoribosyltransferase family protein [Methanomassiliicoccus sp.]|nr:purine phosphoribosyltransferase family protein [Methanomassiliicoccus sp.]
MSDHPLPRLKQSLEAALVIRVGEYDYFVHPLTDGIPRADPLLLSEVVDAMFALADLDCDVIVTPEALGIPLAVGLSLRAGIPYAVVRKRPYGLTGEIAVDQSTGYSKGRLYVNDVRAGDRVVIVDDVLSTGGTLKPLVLALREAGAKVVDIVVMVEKGDARIRMEKELGVRIRSLVRVEVREGRVIVADRIT